MAYQYLLNYLMAYGHVGSINNWRWSEHRRPRNLLRYLASSRTYGNLTVQPVLVPSSPDGDPLNGSLGLEEPWGYLSTGRYEIRLKRRPVSDLMDVVHAALALLETTIVEDDVLVLPLRMGDVPPTRLFSSKQIEHIASRELPVHVSRWGAISAFSGGSTRELHFDDYFWRICSRLVTDPALTRSALYFRAAIKHIHLVGRPVDDAYAWFEEMPSRIHEQVLVESSIQDCLKSIETLYGGSLSRNEHRIRARLEGFGISPIEECGFMRKPYRRATILEKIVELREARDARAAHGGTAESRRNSMYDLCDYQNVTKLILWRAVSQGDEPLSNGKPLTLPLRVDMRSLNRVRRKIPTKVVRTIKA